MPLERGKRRVEWEKLCDARLEDAAVLLRNGRYDAAYYMAGYAVECALKARIVDRLAGYFPPRRSLYIRELETLLDYADLEKVFNDEAKKNNKFGRQWGEIVKVWSEESRYNTYDEKTAQDMVTSVQVVVECIRQNSRAT